MPQFYKITTDYSP